MSKALLQLAIDTFGEDIQIDIAIEECAELIKSLIKNKRGLPISCVAEEIADVEIMCEQLKLIFNCSTEVEIQKEWKLQRLKERIMASKTGGV